MTQAKNFYNLASVARQSAITLERAGRSGDARKARADAIRYDRLAKLATLGAVHAK